MNPVRQYSAKKPARFRIDFFILADHKSYIIHHIDVYQGKNAPNIGIHESIKTCPTTIKAVLNSVIACRLDESPYGARHITLDNRYQSPLLCFVLRERYGILSTGTCRINRIGWDNKIMTLKKSQQRGDSLFAYDDIRRIMTVQWNDSKVVNLVSSVIDNSMTTVSRQQGRRKLDYPCPTVMTKYHREMGGVDKADQHRAAGGGFALKAHYKKWYKKGYFALLDCMLLNAWLGWNISCQQIPNRWELRRHEFYTYVAERMLNFKDDRGYCSRQQAPSPETIRLQHGYYTHAMPKEEARSSQMPCL